jgi:hypothetical protein
VACAGLLLQLATAVLRHRKKKKKKIKNGGHDISLFIESRRWRLMLLMMMHGHLFSHQVSNGSVFTSHDISIRSLICSWRFLMSNPI